MNDQSMIQTRWLEHGVREIRAGRGTNATGFARAPTDDRKSGVGVWISAPMFRVSGLLE
jgi:hypothetical protein